MTHGDDNYFTTISGRRFWPLDPRVEDVCIEDIAHALAHLCRFNGHVRRFYSVAQHSVIVSHHVPAHLALQGLLHDGSEAYLCDLSRVVKHDPGMLAYRNAEHRVQSAVYDAFGVDPQEAPEVKAADTLLLQDEVRCVALNEHLRPAYMRGPGLGVDINAWVPGKARDVFLYRFDQLMKERIRG